MYPIRIHGRGAQGLVSGAEMLSVAAFVEGRCAQAFPSFGSTLGCPSWQATSTTRRVGARAGPEARGINHPGPDTPARSICSMACPHGPKSYSTRRRASMDWGLTDSRPTSRNIGYVRLQLSSSR